MTTWIDTQPVEKIDKMKATLASCDWTRAGRNWLTQANGHEDFAVWMVLVDQRISRFAGLGLFDLGDWNIYDAFEGGYTPAEAAREALESDDTFSVLMQGIDE